VRIDGFRVGGFGLLADLEVSGLGPGTTVVCGPNEAGKSTLHSFLVRTLFGHPRANDARGRERHEPLRGGRHGGVVHALDHAGGRWEVHRYTTGSPVLRVVAPDGSTTTSTDALTELVGRGVDEERYEQVFAIDLDALAGLGSLGDGALDELLLDAATVGAGRSLRGAIAALERRADDLWRPQARKPRLNAEVLALRDAERRLRTAQDDAARYQRAREAVDALAADLAAVRREQREAASGVRRLERLLEAWPTWRSLVDAETRLAEVRGVRVPEELADQVAELRRARAAASGAARDARASAVAEAEAADALAVDDRLARLADRVASHAAGLPLRSDRGDRLREARDEVERLTEVVTTTLAELGDGWDEARVRATPHDPTVPPVLDEATEALSDAARHLADAESRVGDRARTDAEAHERAATLAGAVGDPPSGDLEARATAVAALRWALPDLERGTADAGPPGGAASAWPVAVTGVLAVALLVVGVATLVTGSTVLGMTLLLLAALGGVAAVAAWRSSTAAGGTTSGGVPTAGAAVAARDLGQQVTEAARVLGLTPPIGRSEVELADRRTRQLDADQRAWRERRDAAERADAEVEEARRALDRAERERDERAAAHARAEEAWDAARQRAGLPGAVTPAGARPLLTALAAARRALADRDRAAREGELLRAAVEGFDAATSELCASAGRELGDAPDTALQRLADETALAAAAHEERARRRTAAAQADEEAAALAARVERLDDELAAAHRQVGVTGDDAFDAAVVRDAERRLAETDRAAAERALTGQLGGDDDAARLRDELATGRVAGWTDQLAEVRQQLETLDVERDRLVRAHATATTALRELGEDDAVPAAALRVETHGQRCAELAEAWTTAHLAADLLRTTLQRFETAHQPAVLDRAGALVTEATAGRWKEVRRIDDELYVADGGDPVPAAVLSRGATEQLYLCLRLALAEELNRSGPGLPLLIDDLLANSDPDRADGLARILADVATRQQVVVFTCDPATGDRVVAADPSAGVLSLQAGGTGATWARRPST
jgi:uncharacterized protein YhaN